ncbi:MAG: hypothetical protein NTU80_12475 [Verrucomicrobia bacterium]|nr:hypothetical protein [Verrucomicrobiota bacterium]
MRIISEKIKVDLAVILSAIGYLVSALGAPLVSLLIVTKLNTEEQGYYYTFLSLIALQGIFELGVGQCIVQFTAHEFEKIKLVGNNLSGPLTRISRFRSIVQFSVKFHTLVAVIAFLGVSICGYVFFSGSAIDTNYWIIPWVGLCLAASFNIAISGVLSVVEGCGYVVWINKIRIIINVTRISFLCILILVGAGLYSLFVANLISFLICGFFVL